MKTKYLFIISHFMAFLFGSLYSHSQNIGLVDVRRSESVITVGGPGADIPGFTSGAIQLALDALKARGGGTVKLNAGIYDIIGPVRLLAG